MILQWVVDKYKYKLCEKDIEKFVIDLLNGNENLSMGKLSINGENITLIIECKSSEEDLDHWKELIKKSICMKYTGIDDVVIAFTYHDKNSEKIDIKTKKCGADSQSPDIEKYRVPNVKKIIAISSGKGGVGKSTCAVNLSRALMRRGFSVGIADLDVYGPSIPTILGIEGNPEINEQKKISPVTTSDGLKVISIGFFMGAGQAAIWRGPMTAKFLHQAMSTTDWGNLDYLILDTPPGTGDVHISLLEKYRIDGAVLISTPQYVSLIDVEKSAIMYDKFSINVLGIVENMSYLESDNGSRNYIFGQGYVPNFANQLNIDFIGQVPIESNISRLCDQGYYSSESSELDCTKIEEIFFNISKNLTE